MSFIQKNLLAIQHVFAMFGSTVLVPYITGMDVSLALLCAGFGTLIFHFSTKRMIPAFLGSSFAFIPAIILTLQNYDPAYLKGGIIAAGILYLVFAIIVKYIGSHQINKLLPSIVVGPIIIAIGLKLVPVGLAMSGYSDSGVVNYQSLLIASLSLLIMVIVSFIQHSFFKLMPILISIAIMYVVCLVLGMVETSTIINARWFGFSENTLNNIFLLPKFDFSVILLIAPIGLVTLLEHIGDIKTNGAVVGKDFMQNPGLNKTLMGDGLATIFAGLLGGPANTTYGENTGVLAATKNYDPKNLRLAAVFAIAIAFLGKIVAIIQSIPTPVMGGISLMLFGLIAAVGIRVLVESKVSFSNYKNLVIPAIIIIIGVFVNSLKITDNFIISGLFIATVVGIILNKILPDNI
jgi:uracil permease